MAPKAPQLAAGLGLLITLVMIQGCCCPIELPEGLELDPSFEEGGERARVRAEHPSGVPLHAGVGESGVSGRLPDGAEVRILERAEGGRWVRVRGGGQAGWITSRYLAPAEPSPLTGEVPTPAPEGATGATWGGQAHPFASAAACEQLLSAWPPLAPGRPLRVATWNLRWFPHGHMPGRGAGPGTDVRWMGCAIASLRVDALAVQEIVLDEAGRAALPQLLADLDRRTGGRWQSELDSCPRDGRQHVGFLYDSARLRRQEVRLYPELNPAGGACATRLRPGLALRALAPSGAPIELLSVHLDSGVAERDYGHRQEGYALLAGRLGAPGARLMVLGDVNSMGCEQCGPPVSAEAERAALDGACAAHGVSALPADQPCTELSSHGAAALDRILIAPALLPYVRGGRIEVGGFCQAEGCASRVRRSEAYERLSDHCPLIAELAL